MKKHKIILELTNNEINRLTSIMFKGTCYNETYYDKRTCNMDEKFVQMFNQMLVDGSEKYSGKGIYVDTFNGRLINYKSGNYLF